MLHAFRSKIGVLIFFWAVLLVFLLLPSRYFYKGLRQEIMIEAENAGIRQLLFVHLMLDQKLDFRDAESLGAWLADLGKQLGLRITYMAEGGQVIADSHVLFAELYTLDNHAGRPEIVEARAQEIGKSIRYSRTSQKDFIYLAKSIGRHGAIPAGVVRLAIPWSALGEQFDRLNQRLLYFNLVSFSAIALLSCLLVRRIDPPLGDLIDAVDTLAEQNYGKRLRFLPGHAFYPLAESFNRMAEQIQNHIEMIAEQKNQLEAVFDGMQEGVMVLDSRGKIERVNRALSRIIPNISQSMGRRPLEVIMSLELQEACDRILSSPVEPDLMSQKLQIALWGKRFYDVNVVGLRDQKAKAAIVVFHDISELKHLEKVRQDFVANVSHELRTPLTSIKGYTETLLSGANNDPATLTSFLQVIQKNANHMVKMVDDLLQLARLDAQQAPLKMIDVDPREALAAAWKACMPLAQNKRIRLESDFPEAVRASADFDQLVQVFRNLLENAVKYSPEGETIRVLSEPQHDTVTFGVMDEGPGIPKQHQQRIFERFYRVEKHRSTHPGSTGLGLAICRHIIQNHGGRIWVESPHPSEDKGTTVFFTVLRAIHPREVSPAGEDELLI